MAEAAEWDFIMHNTLFASGVRFIKNLTGELPAGAYKVYLVLKYVRIEKPGSYHWYRQNPDGTWSHKDGNGPVINTVSEDDDTIIWDPATAAKAIGYDGDGCYFAVIPWNEFYKPSDTNQLQDEAMFSATDYVGQEEMEQSSSTADYDEPTQKRMFFVEYQRLNVDRRSDAQFARKKRFGWR